MAKRKIIWVYRSGDVWVVKKAGTTKASAIRNTQKEAYDAARNIALNQNLTIKIRNANGSLRTVSPKQAKDNNCFITTACMNYYGLNDNCYQLQTLRKFRDGYLSKKAYNKKLIKKYYLVAPTIVSLLKADPNKERLYSYIFKNINASCTAIEEKNFKRAKAIYQSAVLHLFNYFKDAL